MKERKILFGITLFLSMVIISVIGQSILRQFQTEKIYTQVRESIAKAGNSPQAKAMALREHKTEIDFVIAHQPILNFKLKLSNTKANADSFWCDFLWDNYYDASFWIAWGGWNDTVESYRRRVVNMIVASECID